MVSPASNASVRTMVDGKPMVDPRGTGNAVNEQKEAASLLALS